MLNILEIVALHAIFISIGTRRAVEDLLSFHKCLPYVISAEINSTFSALIYIPSLIVANMLNDELASLNSAYSNIIEKFVQLLIALDLLPSKKWSYVHEDAKGCPYPSTLSFFGIDLHLRLDQGLILVISPLTCTNKVLGT